MYVDTQVCNVLNIVIFLWKFSATVSSILKKSRHVVLTLGLSTGQTGVLPVHFPKPHQVCSLLILTLLMSSSSV